MSASFLLRALERELIYVAPVGRGDAELAEGESEE